eukprot:1071297-Pyramimonas_sp.AAC.1
MAAGRIAGPIFTGDHSGRYSSDEGVIMGKPAGCPTQVPGRQALARHPPPCNGQVSVGDTIHYYPT